MTAALALVASSVTWAAWEGGRYLAALLISAVDAALYEPEPDEIWTEHP